MAIKVRIPTPLRSTTKGQAEVTAQGATVLDVLRDLGKQYPELTSKLLDEQGRLRRYVNFFVNETDVRDLKGGDSALADGDTLSVMPAIAGG